MKFKDFERIYRLRIFIALNRCLNIFKLIRLFTTKSPILYNNTRVMIQSTSKIFSDYEGLFYSQIMISHFITLNIESTLTFDY